MIPYANLHCHSTHSDGTYSPTELVSTAKKEGYKAIALTDHDTVTGCPEMKAVCEREGLEFIFGAEFCVPGHHIVGFGFDPEYPRMKRYLADMGLRQTDNTKQCFDLAASKGDITGITWDEVLDYNKDIVCLCNNHIYRAMEAKGLVKESDYMVWFKKNFDKQRNLFPPICDFNTPKTMIELIHDAGGIAILAHPHNQVEYIPKLIKYGLDGVEAWHPKMTEAEMAEVHEIAQKNNMFISGGTDHFGLCGGFYGSYANEEELKKSKHYIPELTFGTTKEYFDMIAKAVGAK